MSHIAVELKVIEADAPAVARAAGVSEDRILAGLCRLWHYCWTHKVDILGLQELAGAFGGERIGEIVAALVGMHLLTELDEGGWHVKGADRYLRIQAGRSRGGKAAAGNLKRGTKKAKLSESPGTFLDPKTDAKIPGIGEKTEKSPGTPSGSSPADYRQVPGLSPSTEHRAPSTTTQKPAGKPAADPVKEDSPPPDARHAPLVKALAATFETVKGAKLGFDGRQAKAVTQLLAMGTPEEVVIRWDRALRHVGFPSVASPSELKTCWNHFATEPARKPGTVDAAAQKHTTRVVNDF